MERVSGKVELGLRMGEIRKPRLPEIPQVKALVDASAEAGEMLSRTLAELCESVRDFYVYADEQGVGGCCALHVELMDLAEIRSLVVQDGRRGRRIGGQLIRACLNEADGLGIARVYVLTRVPEFFEKQGFRRIDKHELPHKVFRDCVRCPLFPDCDEVAMAVDLRDRSLNGS